MSLSVKNSCGGKSLPELTNPATESDIEKDKQVIDSNGNLLIGGILKTNEISTSDCLASVTENNELMLSHVGWPLKYIIEKGSNINLKYSLYEMGNAAASDVAAGKTFTSAAGLRVTGTGNFLNIIEGTFDNSSSSDVYTIKIPCPALPKIVILQDANEPTAIGILKFIYSNDFNFGSIRSNYLTGKSRDKFLTSVNVWNFSDGVFTLSVGTNATDYKINKTYNYKIIY